MLTSLFYYLNKTVQAKVMTKEAKLSFFTMNDNEDLNIDLKQLSNKTTSLKT